MTRSELLNLYGQDDDPFRAEANSTIAPENDDERQLADAVAYERERFHELDLTAEPVALRDEAWSRIEAALDTPEEQRVVPIRAAGDEPARSRWKPTALLAMAAALVLGIGLIWQSLQMQQPLVVAVLVDDSGDTVAIIEAFASNRVQVTPLAAISPEGTNVLELWTQPDPDSPPVSVAIMEQGARTILSGPDLPRPRSDQFFAISVEPSGGSPTGLPTGPVIAQGLAKPTY